MTIIPRLLFPPSILVPYDIRSTKSYRTLIVPYIDRTSKSFQGPIKRGWPCAKVDVFKYEHLKLSSFRLWKRDVPILNGPKLDGLQPGC